MKPGTKEWYGDLWNHCEFDKGFEDEIEAAARRVLRSRARYQIVATKTTAVPWWVIGGIHNMESSCDFRGILHNGERIIGTGKKTRLVPKGRGPFDTWEQAALDALIVDGLTLIRDWTIENCLKVVEAYNGTGYLKYHQSERSPYLWACTSVNDGRGKYTGDGKFDPNANANGQVGFAAIVKQLELWKEISIQRTKFT